MNKKIILSALLLLYLTPFSVSAEITNSYYSTIRFILTTYSGEPFTDTSGHWYLKVFNPETLEADEQPLNTDNPDGWPNTIGCPLFKNCSVEYGYRATGTGEILFKKTKNIKARQHRQEITLKIPNRMSVEWEVNLMEKTEDGKRPIEESMCVSLFRPSEDIIGTPQYSKCGTSPIKFTIVPGTYKISVSDQQNLQIFNQKVMENVPIFKSRTSNYNLTRAGKALVTFQFDKPLQADAEVYFDNGTVEKYSLAKGIDKETYEVREGPTKITAFFGTYTEGGREKGGHTFIRQYLIKANSNRLIQLHENYDYQEIAEKYNTNKPKSITICTPEFGEKAVSLTQAINQKMRADFRIENVPDWEADISDCVTTPELAPGYYNLKLLNKTYNTTKEKLIFIGQNSKDRTDIGNVSTGSSSNVTFNIKEFFSLSDSKDIGDFRIVIFNKTTQESNETVTNMISLKSGSYTANITADGYLPSLIDFYVSDKPKSINVNMTGKSQYRTATFYALFDNDPKAPVTINNINVAGEVITETTTNADGSKDFFRQTIPLSINGTLSPVTDHQDGKQKWMASIDIPTNKTIKLNLEAQCSAEGISFSYKQWMRIKVSAESHQGSSIVFDPEANVWTNVTDSPIGKPEFIMPTDIKGSVHSVIVSKKDCSENCEPEPGTASQFYLNKLYDNPNRKIGYFDFNVTAGATKVWLPDNQYLEMKATIVEGVDIAKYKIDTDPNLTLSSLFNPTLRKNSSFAIDRKFKTPVTYPGTTIPEKTIFFTYKSSRTHQAHIRLTILLDYDDPDNTTSIIDSKVYLEENSSGDPKKKWKDSISGFFSGNDMKGPGGQSYAKFAGSFMAGVPHANSTYKLSGWIKVERVKRDSSGNAMTKDLIGKDGKVWKTVPLTEKVKIQLPEKTLNTSNPQGYDEIVERYVLRNNSVTQEEGPVQVCFEKDHSALLDQHAPNCCLAGLADSSWTGIKIYWEDLDSITLAGMGFIRRRLVAVDFRGEKMYMDFFVASESKCVDRMKYYEDWIKAAGTVNVEGGWPSSTYNNTPAGSTSCPISQCAGAFLTFKITNDWKPYLGTTSKYPSTHPVFNKNITVSDDFVLPKNAFQQPDEHIVHITLRSRDNTIFNLSSKKYDMSKTTNAENDTLLASWKNTIVRLKTVQSEKSFKWIDKNLANIYQRKFIAKGNFPIDLRIYGPTGNLLHSGSIANEAGLTRDITIEASEMNIDMYSTLGAKLIVQAKTEKLQGFTGKKVYVTVNPSNLPTARKITQGIDADAYAWWGGTVYELELDPLNPKQTLKASINVNQTPGTTAKLIFYTSDTDNALTKTWFVQFMKSTIESTDAFLAEKFEDRLLASNLEKSGDFLWKQKDVAINSEIVPVTADIPYLGTPPSQSRTFHVTLQASSDEGFRANYIDVVAIAGVMKMGTRAKAALKTLKSVYSDEKEIMSVINEGKYIGKQDFYFGNKSFSLERKNGSAAEIVNKTTGEVFTTEGFLTVHQKTGKLFAAAERVYGAASPVYNITKSFITQPFTKFIGGFKPIIKAILPFAGLPPSGMPLISVRTTEESKFAVPNCVGCSESMQITQWITNLFNKPLAAQPIDFYIQAKNGRSVFIKATAAGHEPFEQIVFVSENTPTDITINVPLHRNDTWGFSSTQSFFEAHPAFQETFEEFLLAPELYAGSNQRGPLLDYISQGLGDFLIAISADFQINAATNEFPQERDMCKPGRVVNSSGETTPQFCMDSITYENCPNGCPADYVAFVSGGGCWSYPAFGTQFINKNDYWYTHKCFDEYVYQHCDCPPGM